MWWLFCSRWLPGAGENSPAETRGRYIVGPTHVCLHHLVAWDNRILIVFLVFHCRNILYGTFVLPPPPTPHDIDLVFKVTGIWNLCEKPCQNSYLLHLLPDFGKTGTDTIISFRLSLINDFVDLDLIFKVTIGFRMKWVGWHIFSSESSI